jgi:hypothetical protein
MECSAGSFASSGVGLSGNIHVALTARFAVLTAINGPVYPLARYPTEAIS